MARKQIERDEVLKPCLTNCKMMLMQGMILEYRRMSEWEIHHQIGAPDIEVRFIHQGLLWLLLAECKKPKGGVIRASQVTYHQKYKDLKNVISAFIVKPSQIIDLVEEITGFNKNMFENMKVGGDSI